MRNLRVGLAAIGICFSALLALPAGAAEALRIAMLPVIVHSSDDTTDYLSEGLADMLTARLERSGALHVVRVDEKSGSMNVSDAVEAGKKVDAEYVLFGSFTQFGQGASFDVRCAPVAEDLEESEAGARQVFIQSGSLAEIIPQLGTLAEKVERFLLNGPPAAPALGGNGAGAYEDLARRVEALERTVYIERAGGPGATPDAPGAGESGDASDDAEPGDAEPVR